MQTYRIQGDMKLAEEDIYESAWDAVFPSLSPTPGIKDYIERIWLNMLITDYS